MKLLERYYTARGRPVPYYARYPLWLLVWKPFRKTLNVVLIPNIPFTGLRIALYRLVGFRIGRGVFIGMKCYLDDVEPSPTTIGDGRRSSASRASMVFGMAADITTGAPSVTSTSSSMRTPRFQ